MSSVKSVKSASRPGSAARSGRSSVLETAPAEDEGDNRQQASDDTEEQHQSMQPQDGGEDISRSTASSRSSTARTRSAKSASKKPAVKLSNITLSDGDEDTDLETEIQKSVDHDTSGKSVYIETCGVLNIVPAKYFLQHLSDRQMVMRHHGLGDAGMKAIAKALRNNITIELLDLSGNGIGEDGGIALGKMLRDNEFITNLVLEDNMLRSIGVYPLLNAVQANNTLRVLNLNGNQINDECAPWLGQLLESNRSLLEVYLSRNDLAENTAFSISTSLASNDTLEVLDLSWNKIRGDAAVQLAKGVRDNVRLKRVNLSWNGFGSVGGCAVADMLCVNETLCEVDVTGNRLDDKCAASFAKSFARNENLRVLKMGYNPITTTGMVQLITALQKADNCRLQHLCLNDIKVEFEFLRAAKEIKMKRPEFILEHGTSLRAGNTPGDIGKPGLDPRLDKHPLLVLKEHILVNDMRFLDILRKLDTENKQAVTKEQFEKGLKELGITYTKEQMKEIGAKLDKQKNGMIYYGDLIPQGPKKEANLLLEESTPLPHDDSVGNGNGNGNEEDAEA